MIKAHLSPCPGCTRHVRVSEIVCPFCQVSLGDEFRAQPAPRPPAGRLGRAALSALGAGTIALASSCSSSNVKPPYGGPPPFDASTDVSPIVDAGADAPPVDRGIVALYGGPPPLDATVDATDGGPATDGAGN